MSYKIYVGNYPLSFTEDDVLNLFQDYEGVELQGFFRNETKCYSFLYCVNKRQLIDIVANLHDIDVCGRNLIVRAASEKLHKEIEKCISKNSSVNFHPRNTCDVNGSTSVNSFPESETRPSKQSTSPQIVNSYSKNTHSPKNEMNASAGYLMKPRTRGNSQSIDKQIEDIHYEQEIHDYSSNSTKSIYSPQNSQYHQNSFCSKDKKASSFSQNLGQSQGKNLDLDFNPQETFSRISKSKTDASEHYKTINERFDFYQKNLYKREDLSPGYQLTDSYQTHNRNVSESLETVQNQPSSQKYENLSFVSVINFPLYLPKRDLYKLFADFNPVKVFIVCNEPRRDKTPTEAIVCFESETEATDAILTLDNTVYRGRILIVTDTVDMSLVSELLSLV